MENYKHPTKRLGKKPFIPKDQDFLLAKLIESELKLPAEYDAYEHWKGKPPAQMWGNDQYGDCVFAARANTFLRLEKVEHRRYLSVVNEMVVDEYKRLTGCQYPGDTHDEGYVIRDALELWRTPGWKLPIKRKKKPYTIDAYARINVHNDDHIKHAIFGGLGVQMGVSLPLSAQHMRDWDVTTGPGSEPGSWGGHAVDVYGYDDAGIKLWTWSQQIHCTWAFVNAYCDEMWAVIDSLETHARWINIGALDVLLAQVGG